MKYFFINTLGEVDGERAILDGAPRELGLEYYRPARGLPVADLFPEDARIVMSKKYKGVKLDSLLGNTKSYLIVKQPVRKVIEAHCAKAAIEYLPFTLYNQKKRVQSKDYVIVNPIGTVDCLNLDESEIEYLDEPGDAYHGSVVGVDRFVLDPARLKDAPALFRIKEQPSEYVINEKLAAAFEKEGFTNIVLTEIEMAERKKRR
jgi:hypothetical protein